MVSIIAGCAGDWVYSSHTNKCYKHFSSPQLPWDEARASCMSVTSSTASASSGSNVATTASTAASSASNGDLASIPDEATNEFMKQQFSKDKGWIGGHLDSDGNWAWSDGTPWSYTAWGDGSPDNPIGNIPVTLKEKSGLWSDVKQKFVRSYFCQNKNVIAPGTSMINSKVTFDKT